MPSQHSASTTPVHTRQDRDLVAAARERLTADGATMSGLVAHALREYAAGRFILPPAPPA